MQYSKRWSKNVRDRSKFEITRADKKIIIGERSEPPLSVELSEFSLYLFIYLFIYMFIYIYTDQQPHRMSRPLATA